MQGTSYTRNEVTFTGRLGRDPEMIYTKNGKAVTSMSLAVDQGKTKDAMWLVIKAWEDLGEEINEKASKGNLIQVSGYLSQHKYKEMYRYEVVAKEIEVLEGGKATGKTTSQAKSGLDADHDDLDEHPF